MFMEHQQDNFSAQLWQANSEQVLDCMLTNDTLLKLLQTRGYHNRFVEYCIERADFLKRQRVISLTSIQNAEA